MHFRHTFATLPMNTRFLRLFFLSALFLGTVCGARGQVILNEASSVQSDRLLQTTAGGQKKLGNLPAWYDTDFAVPVWWQSGAGPLGFGYTVGTDLQTAMLNKTPVAYVRRDFTLTAGQAGGAGQVELVIDYDDGFVAYLNGVEVARRNTGAAQSFPWHSQPAFNAKTAGTAETISLGVASTLLRTGGNVLAIQIHNSDQANGQLYCSATLRLAGGANLVVPTDLWSWLAGTAEPSGGLYDASDFGTQYLAGPNWTQPDYDDTAWTSAPGSIGYDTQADYLPQLGVNLHPQMLNQRMSVYMRREFTLTQAQYDALSATSLTVDWDDGYVLYLNGYELSRANLSATVGSFVGFNDSASSHNASRDSAGNNPAAIVSVPVPRNMLRVGKNVISGQLHNSGAGSSDLLLDVRFSGTSGGSTLTWVALGSTWRYKIPAAEFGIPAPAASAPITPELLDWVELKNTGASVADISGWHLTDDSAVPDKWTFPAGTTIPAGGYLVVACSGRDVTAPAQGGLLHTNFSLNSKGETIGLRDAAGTVRAEMASVPDQDAFHTWGLDPATTQFRYLDRGTPGAENVVSASGASDTTAEVDFDKATGFYNSSITVALTTTTPGASIRYTLDGSEPTATTGALYIVPFDPAAAAPSQGPGAGNILREMFQWNGAVVTPPNLPANAVPTSSSLIYTLETPSNISDYYTHRVRGYLHAPQTGNYEFWLATDDDGELWLSTTDQPASKVLIASIVGNWAAQREWTKLTSQHSVTIPLVAGQRYYIEVLESEGGGGDNLAVGWSGPGLPSGINVIEGRYLSPPATLPPGTTLPPGNGVVRARAFAAGRLPSPVRTRNYIVGMDARVSAVPAFFLTGSSPDAIYSPNGFFSQVGGNFTNGSWAANDARTDYNFCLMHGDAFERPVNMEIISAGNVVVERTTVGARFSGSPWSRPQYQLSALESSAWNSSWVTKPQINIFFRSDFGISQLKKNGFIPTSRLDTWDELRLRAGKNDAYNPFIVDEWMRRTFAGMGAPSPQGFFATLFLNGKFKSYFNPTERPRKVFFQQFYNSSSDWDVQYNSVWEDGDGVTFAQMQTYFQNTDFSTLTNYQTGAAYWDMTNVADYFVINGWGATQDWPHNNFIFARDRAPGSLWRFSMWDAEGGMGVFGQANTHNTFETELHVSSGSSPGTEGTVAALVFRRAYQNAEFKMLFADRLQKHFFNGGTMTRTNMQARWDSMRATMEPVIAAVIGGGFYNGYWDNWANRDATFLAQCRTLGMWPVTRAPNAAPFGGTMSAGGTITLTNPNGAGTIYYTTNGTDPRAVGGAIQGTAYTAPLPVASPYTLKARIRSTGGEWSPVIEASYVPPPPLLRITELNYNPPSADDLTEFIEITNVGGQTAGLNGAHFTAGITYTFGNVTLAPGQCVILVRDSAAFTAAYPGVPIGGIYTGQLDNGGETLTLRDLAENILINFTYQDSNTAGWPASADGGGTTLILNRAFATSTDPNLAANWRASTATGGTPGTVDSTVFTGTASGDADHDGFPALIEYALGTADTSGAARPQLNPARDGTGHLVITFPHPTTADDVLVEALESTDLITWTPAVSQSETAYAPGWMQSSWRSNATGPRVYLRLRATLLP